MDMNRGVLMTSASLAELPDFAVGDIRVCPSSRTLDGPGGTIQVEPRVMQVLIVLADADGAVVSRDTLLNRCWGGVYVGDDSLNRAVAGVRRVASRIGGNSLEIETIPRTGYRLISRPSSSVEPHESDESQENAQRSRSSADGRVDRRAVLGTGLAAAAAASGAIVLWTSRRSERDPAERMMEESRLAMRAGTPETERQAISLLERAVSESPTNGAAWGLLALSRARADEHSTTLTPSSAQDVRSAADRALQLDETNADARAALAIAVPYYGDWFEAERRFDAVLKDSPNHVFTRDSRTFFLGAVGRMRESALSRLTFSRDDAFDANFQYRHIYALWFLARIAEADRAAARGLEMWPKHPGIWFARLWVLAGTGRFDRALAHIDDEPSRPTLPPTMFATLKVGLTASKNRQRAEVLAATKLVMTGVERSVAAVVNAMMLLNLMDATDAAFDLARAYYLEQGPIIAAMQWRPGQPDVPDQRRRKTNMLFTPTAAAMQKDSRFLPLMEEMGLADYWKRRGVVPDFLAPVPFGSRGS
jgi:DNA-binding winged helix-turn-helix (wHTH) protein/tetratricopeptide (TPR) repeat protein